MTPGPLTQLLTDLRALVATMLPAIDLLQTDLAGAASHGTQRLHRAGVAPAPTLGMKTWMFHVAGPRPTNKKARREPGQRQAQERMTTCPTQRA